MSSKAFQERNEELEQRLRSAMKAIDRFRNYEQGGSGQGGPTAWETVNAVEAILAPNRAVSTVIEDAS